MNTDETVRACAVISVTTTYLVIPSLEIVADALTVIEMQNAMKVRDEIEKRKLNTKQKHIAFLSECVVYNRMQ